MTEQQKPQLLKARVSAFKKALVGASEKAKAENATLQIVDNFNRIVEDTRQAFPQIADSLPALIPKTDDLFALDFGLSRATYLDLEIYVEQIMGVLGCVDAES